MSAFQTSEVYNYVVIDASLVRDAASYEYLENILLSMLKVNHANVPAVCVVADNSESSATLKSICENFGVDLIGLQNKGEEDPGSYIAANFKKAAMKAPVPENKYSAYSHAIYPVNHISESVTITDTTKTFTVYGSYVIVKTDSSQSGTFSANVGGPIHTESLKSNLASGTTYSFYRLGQGQHELQITAEGTVAVTAIYSDAKPLYESLVMLGFEDNDLSASTTNRTGGTSKVDLKVVSDSEKGNVLNVKGINNGSLVIPAKLSHGQKYRISGQFKVLSMQNDGDYLNLYINQKTYADDSAEEKILSGNQVQGTRKYLKPVIGEWVDFSEEYTPAHTVNDVETSDYTEISFMLGSGYDTCEYRIDNIVIEPVVEDTALKIGYPGSKYENGLIQDFNDDEIVSDWGNRSATNVVQNDGTLKIATDNVGKYNPEIARINNIYLTPGRYYKVSFSVWTTDDEEYTLNMYPLRGATRQLRSDGTTPLAPAPATSSYKFNDKVTKTKTTYEHIFNLERQNVSGNTKSSDDAGVTSLVLQLFDSNGAKFETWGNKTIYMDDFKLEPLELAYNGDFEKGAAYYGAHGGLATSIVEEDGNNVLKVDTPCGYPVSFYPDLFQGRAYRISMDIKGDADAVAAGGKVTATFETTSDLGGYSTSPISNVAVTTEWKTITAGFAYHNDNYLYQAFPHLKIKPSSTGSAGNIFIDNVKVEEISLAGNYIQDKNIYGGNFRERVVMGSDDKNFKDGFLYKVYSEDENDDETIYTFGEGKVHRVMFNLNSPDERIDILMDSAIVWGSAKATLGYGDISEWGTVKLGTVKRSNAKITAEFTTSDFTKDAILKGKADVDNNDTPKSIVVLMAVYNSDNKLIDVKKSAAVEVGKQGKKTVTIESAALSDTANSAKLFVLDSVTTISPYIPLVEGESFITKTVQ